jgi:hypothetical protein
LCHLLRELPLLLEGGSGLSIEALHGVGLLERHLRVQQSNLIIALLLGMLPSPSREALARPTEIEADAVTGLVRLASRLEAHDA